VSVKTEGKHAGEFLVSEAPGSRSREVVTVLSGQNLKAGDVLGRITLGAVTAAAKAGGNTGTGTCTVDATTPRLAGCQVGVYKLRCITAAANSGTFRLTDPSGYVLGDYTITGGAGGTVTTDKQIKVAIADAGTDFVAGDGFDVTVAAGSGKHVLIDPEGDDGSQFADGILYAAVHADGADAEGVAIVRDAEVNKGELGFSDADPTETAAIVAQLAGLGIICREAV
jgi:hypothetical protein